MAPNSFDEDKPSFTHAEGVLPSLDRDLEGSSAVDEAEESRIMYVDRMDSDSHGLVDQR